MKYAYMTLPQAIAYGGLAQYAVFAPAVRVVGDSGLQDSMGKIIYECEQGILIEHAGVFTETQAIELPAAGAVLLLNADAASSYLKQGMQAL